METGHNRGDLFSAFGLAPDGFDHAKPLAALQIQPMVGVAHGLGIAHGFSHTISISAGVTQTLEWPMAWLRSASSSS